MANTETPTQLDEFTALADVWRSTLARRRDLPLDDVERNYPGFDSFNSALAVCLKQLDQTIARIREDMEV
jgi:hypothetical protein